MTAASAPVELQSNEPAADPSEQPSRCKPESGTASRPVQQPEPERAATALAAAQQSQTEPGLAPSAGSKAEQPGPAAGSSALSHNMTEPEPEPEPAAPLRVLMTVADLLAQAPSEHGDEHLAAYWEDYAASHENRALDAFNTKPKKGVELAVADGLCVEEARSIAMFLLHAPGLDKTQIGEYVGNPADLNMATLREYVHAIGSRTFPRLGFDDALRMFLQGFRLPGEAAPIERCMEAFSDAFRSAQPDLFEKEDTAFLLAYSTIMLNTDLHNDAQKNKMSKKSFVERTQSTAADRKLTAAYLGTIYDRILTNEIQMNDDGGNGMDLTSVWTYSKPRIQGYLTKKGHKIIRTNNDYWAVLKGGALMLLDKPPALNAKPMLCLKMILPSISVGQKGRSFEIVAPEGEAIIATRFNERNEESEDVEVREYSKYTFEAESAEVATQWTKALLDEFGEHDDGVNESAGASGVQDGDCDNRDGPTEQADDLRQDEMEQLIAESRLIVASECLAAAEYENARLAYGAALQLSPHGPRAQEAKRGLDEAEKGIKLERAAVQIAPIVDNFRQSLADESPDEAASDAVLEVQQALSSVLGVEPSASSPREQLQYRCIRTAEVTETLEYETDNPCIVDHYSEGEVVDVLDVKPSASGMFRFLTSKGWCSMVSDSGDVLFEDTCGGRDAYFPSTRPKDCTAMDVATGSHDKKVEAMAAQIQALTEENNRLRSKLEQGQSHDLEL